MFDTKKSKARPKRKDNFFRRSQFTKIMITTKKGQSNAFANKYSELLKQSWKTTKKYPNI